MSDLIQRIDAELSAEMIGTKTGRALLTEARDEIARLRHAPGPMSANTPLHRRLIDAAEICDRVGKQLYCGLPTHPRDGVPLMAVAEACRQAAAELERARGADAISASEAYYDPQTETVHANTGNILGTVIIPMRSPNALTASPPERQESAAQSGTDVNLPELRGHLDSSGSSKREHDASNGRECGMAEVPKERLIANQANVIRSAPAEPSAAGVEEPTFVTALRMTSKNTGTQIEQVIAYIDSLHARLRWYQDKHKKASDHAFSLGNKLEDCERDREALAARLRGMGERRWPDDFETGMQHAYEIAACQPDLHTALRAIADEIQADACHPHEHECPTCGMRTKALSAVERDREALRKALQELVRLKDMADEIDRLEHGGQWPDQSGRADILAREYKAKKPAAWDAARAALSASPGARE